MRVVQAGAHPVAAREENAQKLIIIIIILHIIITTTVPESQMISPHHQHKVTLLRSKVSLVTRFHLRQVRIPRQLRQCIITTFNATITIT
jgi:hypothetical protein